jgi:hypothetical protein
VSKVILVDFGPAKLEGHVSTYDAIATNEDLEEFGLYQMDKYPDTYYNGVRGVSLSRKDWI